MRVLVPPVSEAPAKDVEDGAVLRNFSLSSSPRPSGNSSVRGTEGSSGWLSETDV